MKFNTNLLELGFNEYTYVSLKDLNAERIRQCDLLSELKSDEENNKETIDKILSNINKIDIKIKRIKKEKRTLRFDSGLKWFAWSIMIIYCLSLLVFPIWMVKVSIQDNSDYLYNMLGFVKKFDFTNYSNVFNALDRTRLVTTRYGQAWVTDNIWTMLLTSLGWSIGSSLVSVILTTMMAYIISKYRFPGRNFIYSLGIILMIIPIVGGAPSAMIIRSNWLIPTYDNLFLTIITSSTTCFSGLHFLLLYGAFRSIPWDYAEAVFVDGGGHYSAFFKMYLPMILPTSAVIFLLSFLGAWNDFQTFKIWLPSYTNLAYGLYNFQNDVISGTLDGQMGSIPMVMAGFTVIVIPTVIVYLLSQKLIMSKFTVGGLKG